MVEFTNHMPSQELNGKFRPCEAVLESIKKNCRRKVSNKSGSQRFLQTVQIRVKVHLDFYNIPSLHRF